MSQFFAVGVCTAFFGLLVPALYWLRLGVIGMGTWLTRKPFTKERKGVITIICLVIGLIFGSFVQPQYEGLTACYAEGNKIVECILKPAE